MKMKRRGVKEVSLRKSDPRNSAYEADSLPQGTKPLPESERLRLYDVAVKIQAMRNKPPDPNKTRAREERDALEDLQMTFINDLSEWNLLGSLDGTNYGTFTWPDKNLTVKITHLSLKRKQLRHMVRDWQIEFFN